MMHADLEQPIQLDDFDDPNASAVRNLYLGPDAPAPAADNSHRGADASLNHSLGGADASPDDSHGGADDSHGGADASPGVPRGGATASVVTDLHGGDADGPKPGATAAGQIRGLIKDNVILRPACWHKCYS